MGISHETCEKIKAMYKDGKSCVEIAKLFKLSESIIRSIVNR